MEAPLLRLVQPIGWLFALSLTFHTTTSLAATTAYMSSTEQLDLRQIQLMVIAPDKLKAALHHRALTLFAEAGLPIPGSDLSQRPPSAVLTLTLDSRRIDDLCSGKVLYEQGVYLIEQVRVTRRPLVMLWSDIWFKESLRIVPPRSLLELEADQRLLLQEFLQSHVTK